MSHNSKLTVLTHWGRVTHICVGKTTFIGWDNGLLPGRRQAIIWTNAGILLIGPLGTNFSEMLIEIHTFLFKNIHLKMSSGKCRPTCLSLNVLSILWLKKHQSPNNRSWWNKTQWHSVTHSLFGSWNIYLRTESSFILMNKTEIILIKIQASAVKKILLI